MSRMVSFFVLIAIILLIGFLFFRVMLPFLLPLFLAALLVVICHPVHDLILKRCRYRRRVASALTTALVLLIVLLPFLGITFMAVADGSALLARQNPSELRERIARARDRFELLRMPCAEQLRNTQNAISTLVSDVDQYSPESTRPMIADVIENVSELRSAYPDTSEKVASTFETILSKLREAQASGENALAGSAYREAIRRAATEFQNVKIELLGGEFQAWIKEMANPTEDDLQQNVRELLDNTKGMLFSIGGRTTVIIGRMVVGVVIMAVAMFFFLCDGPGMIDTLMRLSPLDDRYERELLADFSKVSRAVVLATLLSATAQGILAGIGYYLIGLHGAVLLTLLTALLAMVPFVGAAAVWVPVVLWLYFIDERVAAAVLLAVHGMVLVSNIDNVIKPLVLHGKSQLHPL
ncbi:MAG: AI-2E family transporter, partial [Planctomycetota bacterium]